MYYISNCYNSVGNSQRFMQPTPYTKHGLNIHITNVNRNIAALFTESRELLHDTEKPTYLGEKNNFSTRKIAVEIKVL